MIISHELGFVFVKPTKVAGTSMEIALSKYCGASDVITPIHDQDERLRQKLRILGPQNYRKCLWEYDAKDWGRLLVSGRCAVKYREHMMAQEIKNILGEDIWRKYKKISMVRNPFDCAISRYFWMRRRGHLDLSFEHYIKSYPEHVLANQRRTHINGVCSMDFMVRFEYLEKDLLRLAEFLGLQSDLFSLFKQLSTKGDVRPPMASMEAMFGKYPDCIEIVRCLCREEIERYDFMVPASV